MKQFCPKAQSPIARADMLFYRNRQSSSESICAQLPCERLLIRSRSTQVPHTLAWSCNTPSINLQMSFPICKVLSSLHYGWSLHTVCTGSLSVKINSKGWTFLFSSVVLICLVKIYTSCALIFIAWRTHEALHQCELQISYMKEVMLNRQSIQKFFERENVSERHRFSLLIIANYVIVQHNWTAKVD